MEGHEPWTPLRGMDQNEAIQIQGIKNHQNGSKMMEGTNMNKPIGPRTWDVRTSVIFVAAWLKAGKAVEEIADGSSDTCTMN